MNHQNSTRELQYSAQSSMYKVLNYYTCAVITCNLYIYYPIFKDHSFVFKEFLSENSVLTYVWGSTQVIMARRRYILFTLKLHNLSYFNPCPLFLFRKLQLPSGQVPSTEVHWLPHGPVLRPHHSHSGHLLGVILDGSGFCPGKNDPWGHYFIDSVYQICR